jgi:hypothetical protein
MKATKSFFVAAVYIALALASAAFAQEPAEQRAKVAALIKADLFGNKEEIQREASFLSSDDKEALYKRYRFKHAWAWGLIDFGAGFGVGSYIQGDMWFGTAQLLIDLTGWMFFLGDNEDMMLPGLILLGSSRIMSWIVPFTYQSKHNKNLREALGHNDFAYSVNPLIVPRQDGTLAVGLAFSVRY